jgi:hypothetical protein
MKKLIFLIGLVSITTPSLSFADSVVDYEVVITSISSTNKSLEIVTKTLWNSEKQPQVKRQVWTPSRYELSYVKEGKDFPEGKASWMGSYRAYVIPNKQGFMLLRTVEQYGTSRIKEITFYTSDEGEYAFQIDRYCCSRLFWSKNGSELIIEDNVSGKVFQAYSVKFRKKLPDIPKESLPLGELIPIMPQATSKD